MHIALLGVPDTYVLYLLDMCKSFWEITCYQATREVMLSFNCIYVCWLID